MQNLCSGLLAAIVILTNERNCNPITETHDSHDK
jgi:hypothetical protein